MVKRQQFPHLYRLKKPAEFRAVFNIPKKITEPPIAVFWQKNLMAHPRLGLAIAKKNIRHAVMRNRIKRVLREYFRQHRLSLGGFDIIIVAYKGAEALNRTELRHIVQKLWKKLQVQCANSASN